MSKTVLLLDDRRRTNCIRALTDLYAKQNDNNTHAIDFCREQLSLYEQHLSENHTGIAYLLMKLGELYEEDDNQKIQAYKRALHILEKNVHLEYATTANCLTLVAQYYTGKSMHEEALVYYKRAMEIQKKIYPAGLSILIETQKLIDRAEQNDN
ncbi:unnamed protein product [Didymodactylos carnosus]|uniref:Tetratricopeptide repeat protein n=1 Tax=Didymodactylos carnosus TaxID=1234261 RepID=A0A816ATN3_9BILA|nr:unnamed protein product [Didymodactylos carnosus]CAF4477616.1 unnamed protein product [Didymodactylos carnosus]